MIQQGCRPTSPGFQRYMPGHLSTFGGVPTPEHNCPQTPATQVPCVYAGHSKAKIETGFRHINLLGGGERVRRHRVGVGIDGEPGLVGLEKQHFLILGLT